jgi:Mor family transcriptional regulator
MDGKVAMSAARHRHVSDQNRSPEFLRDLSDNLKASLIAAGTPEGEATDIANDVCYKMTKTWGGTNVYFPKSEVMERARRDVDIYDDWRAGMGYAELALKYGTTEVWARVICNRMHADYMDKKQPKLFG